MSTSALLIGAGLALLGAVLALAPRLTRGGRIHHGGKHRAGPPGRSLAYAVGDPEYLDDLPAVHRWCETCGRYTPGEADGDGGHTCPTCGQDETGGDR